ncbi:MAG TPA: outer membrane beta-barrel protein [Candidatus Acidoferrales bacterium]|nr:outer membrane beta-barrel protein [Candidatus Acidoferrales bacterium]
MSKLPLNCLAKLAVCALVAAAGPGPCLAQTANAASSQTLSPERRAAILQELEAMKKRIDALEAELNSGDQPVLVSRAVESSPVAGSPLAAPSAAPVLVSTRESSSLTPAVPAQVFPEPAPQKKQPSEPFAFADFTWMNGNPREKDTPLDTKLFTPEFRADVSYIYDFNHPKDDTLVGSSESGRAQEVQVQQLGIGGDFHYNNVRGRLMTQFGMYSTMTPRNDASPARGQWDLSNAYRYLSEAYGGYHFNVMHGVNVDAGIFMSYIGLVSYYNYDNWAYQPSYVSSNTPWYFEGLRVQIFPTDKLKIEPWFINGWQSYGRFNKFPGLGGQIAWRPNGWLSFVFNNYGMGTDTLGAPGRSRLHTDDSVEVKYFDNPDKTFDKAAFSLTGDAGCEYGGGVSCHGGSKGGPKQSFLGYMLYNRLWFDKDKYGFTLGGGKINNPGRYLVLLPPINGATAASGTPYFTENPGDPFKAWDVSGTFDYMPSQYVTFRWEYDHRAANVPYFTGPGGVTPPGGNQGAPGSLVPGFTPDLRKFENRLNLSVLVKF